MKTFILMMTMLGPICAFADQEYVSPTYKGKTISARSNKDAVCKFLTHNDDSEASSYVVERMNYSGMHGFVVIKDKSVGDRDFQWFGPSGRAITKILCTQ